MTDIPFLSHSIQAIEEDSSDVDEIQSFRDSVANLLQPSLAALFGVADPVLAEAAALSDALEQTEDAFITFTRA